MTAPRRTARPSPSDIRPKRQPGAATIFFLAVLLAQVLPIAVVIAVFAVNNVWLQLALSAAICGAAMGGVITLTRYLAGRPLSMRAIAPPVVVTTGVLLGAYTTIAVLWDEARGDYADFIGLDILFPMLGMAAVTLVIVSTALLATRA